MPGPPSGPGTRRRSGLVPSRRALRRSGAGADERGARGTEGAGTRCGSARPLLRDGGGGGAAERARGASARVGRKSSRFARFHDSRISRLRPLRLSRPSPWALLTCQGRPCADDRLEEQRREGHSSALPTCQSPRRRRSPPRRAVPSSRRCARSPRVRAADRPAERADRRRARASLARPRSSRPPSAPHGRLHRHRRAPPRPPAPPPPSSRPQPRPSPSLLLPQPTLAADVLDADQRLFKSTSQVRRDKRAALARRSVCEHARAPDAAAALLRLALPADDAETVGGRARTVGAACAASSLAPRVVRGRCRACSLNSLLGPHGSDSERLAGCVSTHLRNPRRPSPFGNAAARSSVHRRATTRGCAQRGGEDACAPQSGPPAVPLARSDGQ